MDRGAWGATVHDLCNDLHFLLDIHHRATFCFNLDCFSFVSAVQISYRNFFLFLISRNYLFCSSWSLLSLLYLQVAVFQQTEIFKYFSSIFLLVLFSLFFLSGTCVYYTIWYCPEDNWVCVYFSSTFFLSVQIVCSNICSESHVQIISVHQSSISLTFLF